MEARGLTSDGDLIEYKLSDDGTQLIATAEGRPIFTLDLTDPNNYQFTLEGPIDHPADGDVNSDLQLTFDFLTEDADGDSATGSFTISIQDDQPMVVAPEAGEVSEDGLRNGNTDGPAPLVATGIWGSSPMPMARASPR